MFLEMAPSRGWREKWCRDDAFSGLAGVNEGVAGDGASPGLGGGERVVAAHGTVSEGGVTTVVYAFDAGEAGGGGDKDGITSDRGEDRIANDGNFPIVGFTGAVLRGGDSCSTEPLSGVMMDKILAYA